MKNHVVCLLLAGWVAACPQRAAAKPIAFDCSLNRVETTKSGQFAVSRESRSISLSIDDAEKKIVVGQNGTSRQLAHVMITEIAISGYAGTMSLGLQRSSGNVVLQTYGRDASKAEFGLCVADNE